MLQGPRHHGRAGRTMRPLPTFHRTRRKPAWPPLSARVLPGGWRSQAEGRWLIVGNEGDQEVEQGSVVVITEGARDVAFFAIEHMTSADRR